MRKPTNHNPNLWKNSSKGLLSSQITHNSVQHFLAVLRSKKAQFLFGAKHAQNCMFHGISMKHTHSRRNIPALFT